MKVKGNILLARKSFVEKHFGADGWARVLQSLDAKDRAVFEGAVSNVGWYAFGVGQRLDAAIVKVLGNGDQGVFKRMGAASAQANLTTVHKNFLVPGNPQGFLAHAPIIYRFYYDTGRREYESTGPHSGVLTTYDADTFSKVDCLTVIGWYEEALKMCGAKEAVVVEEACRAQGKPHCRYRLQWKT
jgi:uncharacterized protein (TIGR02265 family)